MNCVNVNVELVQVFLITNDVGMIIDVGVNIKNWLIKECVINDLFGTLVIVSAIDKSCDVGEYLDYENCKCRKKIVDKLVEECIETVEEVKLAKINLSENENKNKCSVACWPFLNQEKI